MLNNENPTGETGLLVVHKGTHIEANVTMKIPRTHRLKIVKQAKVGDDSFEHIELGLVKYCNVDLGHRIQKAKAKKKAAKPVSSRKSAPKRKRISDAERKANTRRLVAQIARGSVCL
jgi:hypothetical protein